MRKLTCCTIEWVVGACVEHVLIWLNASVAHLITYHFNISHHTKEIAAGQFGQLVECPSFAEQVCKQNGILGSVFEANGSAAMRWASTETRTTIDDNFLLIVTDTGDGKLIWARAGMRVAQILENGN